MKKLLFSNSLMLLALIIMAMCILEVVAAFGFIIAIIIAIVGFIMCVMVFSLMMILTKVMKYN